MGTRSSFVAAALAILLSFGVIWMAKTRVASASSEDAIFANIARVQERSKSAPPVMNGREQLPLYSDSNYRIESSETIAPLPSAVAVERATRVFGVPEPSTVEAEAISGHPEGATAAPIEAEAVTSDFSNAHRISLESQRQQFGCILLGVFWGSLITHEVARGCPNFGGWPQWSLQELE